ncbi:MAG TPA: M48 family metallopeptidase [Solirubrobacteraceae bacterium]|jgi:STE24 endopeptidase|nr:M48 family metallopeptidase [Solirubrobacteraceae bacterium]
MTPRQPRRGWIGPLAAALGVAQLGTRALRPRGAPPRPQPVRVEDYFSRDELARTRAYGRPQLALSLASTLVRAGVLVMLVRRRPVGRTGSTGREVAGGAGLAVGLTLAGLPLDAVRRRRSLAVGLATQSWGAWAGDLAKSSLIGATLAGGGAPVVLRLMRRHPDRWWIEAAAGSVGLGVVATLAAPVVLDPIFNRFTRLEPGETRDDVLELAGAAGVGLQDVYTVDASRRTTAANAYVTGLGATRRVVLFDTLLATFNRDETRLVVAHELAHVRHRDVSRGLVQSGLVAPAAMLAVARLTRRLDRGSDAGVGSLPALALALGIVGGSVGIVSNQLSRAVERRADGFALELTDAPAAFASFERRIVLANLGDPDPPRWFNVLLATHPPAVERIAIARAHAAGSGQDRLLGT